MTNDILRELTDTNNTLFERIASFDEAALNTIPFADSWTAAQVAVHLFKSDMGMLKLLHGPVKTTSRPPDEEVGKLRDIFLNFEAKYNAPTFTVPAAETYEKDAVISSLRDTRTQLDESFRTMDLTATTGSSPLGELTRLEILHFVLFHTQRHIRQLENIYARVHA